MTLTLPNQANRGDRHHIFTEFTIIDQLINGGASVAVNTNNSNDIGGIWWCTITAIVGAPVVTLTIQGQTYDSIGNTWTILQSAPIVATGITILRIFPHATPAPNLTANDWLPPRFNFIADVVGGGTSATMKIIQMTRAVN